jgi:FtsH-binding integral membrane protein
MNMTAPTNEGGAMNGLTTTQDLTTGTPARTRSGPKRFALHVAEMLAAMGLGMLVLGGAVAGVLALAGTSLSDAPASVHAAVMGVNMTVPMVWWMHYRGHPARHNLEMAASMLIPTAGVIALYWLGAITADSVMAIQHVVMIPAMVGVMLWRYDHYSH